jgi:hypothetical protein
MMNGYDDDDCHVMMMMMMMMGMMINVLEVIVKRS